MNRKLLAASAGLIIAGLIIAAPASAQEPAAQARPVQVAAADTDQQGAIVVVGARTETPSLGALGDRPVLDTPFSINTYDSSLIKDIQATSLTDLFKLEPSATVNLPAQSEYSGFLLRGFTAGDQYVNSVPGGPSESLELYDSVQILKGAAGFLYGFTAPGGIINFVTKRPTSGPFVIANFGFQDSGVLRGHVDASIGTPDGMVATRLNLVGENGRFLYINSKTRRYAIGLNTDVGLTPTTVLQVDYSRERRRRFGNSYGFYLDDTDVPVPDPISGKTRLTPDFSNYRGHLDSIAPALMQQLGGGWVARLDTALSRSRRNYHDAEGDGLMADGSYSLGLYSFNAETNTRAGQLVVIGTVVIGPLSHALVVGGSYTRSTQKNGRNADGTNFGAVSAGEANINDGDVPDFADPRLENPSLKRAYRAQRATDKALFLSDSVSIGNFDFLLGGRYIWREQERYDEQRTVTGGYDRGKLTPTAAALWKPAATTTLYVSFAEALQNGGTAGANTTNAGEQLPPIASKQYEAGVKTRIGQLLATAAVFRIDRGFEFLRRPGGGALATLVQEGIERHDGLELNLSGRLGEQWRFSGGFQLLDPTTRDGDPALAGKRPPAVPKTQGKLFAEYAPPVLPGWAVNGIFTYAGATYLDPTNRQRLDDYVTFEAGARYNFRVQDTDLTLRAAVENVFAKKYWLRTDALIPGAPRAVNFSLQAGF